MSNTATLPDQQLANKVSGNTPAYAAQGPQTPLAPFAITRREVGPKDVQIDILYCGALIERL